MNSKRLIGTEKIFMHSGGVAILLAVIVWLLINGAFTVYMSDKWDYHGGTYDILTPGIFMAISMAIYYRYWKMCAANNALGKIHIRTYSFLSVFFSAMFAAADLRLAEFFLQTPYKAITRMKIEIGSTYLSKLINAYKDMLDSLSKSDPQYLSEIMLLVFISVTLCYYCFWMIGSYFMRCFIYQKRKRLIYTGIMTMLVPVLMSNHKDIIYIIELSYKSEWIIYVLISALSLIIVIGFLTDPILIMFSELAFLHRAIANESVNSLAFNILVFVIFASVMHLCVKFIDKGLFQGRKIKKALKKYEAENNIMQEDNENE